MFVLFFRPTGFRIAALLSEISILVDIVYNCIGLGAHGGMGYGKKLCIGAERWRIGVTCFLSFLVSIPSSFRVDSVE